mgnify:CR=1 FL=1
MRFIGPVLLYEIRRSPDGSRWQRTPEPMPLIDPGERGLICSWKDRSLRSNHVINFMT